MKRRSVERAIIVAGLVIAAIGLTLHFAMPGTTRSGFNVIVEASSSSVEHISFELGQAEYEFGIEMLPPEQVAAENSTGYILSAQEYARYVSGTPIDDVDAMLCFDSSSRTSYETTLTTDLDIYIVFFNADSDVVGWTYYYVVLPPGFYSTLSVAFMGIFVALAGLGWSMVGWRRYFIIGVGINLLLFFIRTFTLSTYSLDLPPIFEELIHVELYNDYQFFYLSWIPTLLEGAWPYSADLAIYLYPPLWIYTAAILGSVPSWLPGVPLFAFNVGTGFLVHEIAKQLTKNEMYALYAMMLYLLNPITLFYGSFMWLNPTPYVFFTMVSFYLALTEKEELAIAAIAVATLYKQLAVVFFPILSITLLKRRADGRIKERVGGFFKHTIIYAGIVLLVSLPFLIVSPDQYLNQMLFWNTGNYETLRIFIPELWMTVHLNTFFLWLGFPAWFTDAIALLLVNYVFLIICALVVYGTFAVFQPGKTGDNDAQSRIMQLGTQALLWGFVAVICVQLFYPRGAYKFYLLALTPFASLLFDYKNLDLQQMQATQFQKRFLMTLILSSIVFVCYRFVYFWVLGVWLLFMMWRGGVLSQIGSAFKSVVRPYSMERESLSVYEEIYGDDFEEFELPETESSDD